jgi:elongation factor G
MAFQIATRYACTEAYENA